MQIGVVYPQTEFGNDPVAIRDYAQMVEELGFSHIVAYDHVLGANPDRPGGWKGPYTYQSAFQSPFLLFSFMAAVTERLGFATEIIILPQRQTALVAKQAATLDVLCGGRLRLGVGLGWNKIEYVALGQNFHDRGKRIEEQVALMRQLWTEPLVEYSGRWHTIQDAGINPLPIQRPIPIWFGGHADPVLWRVAMMGNGWMTNYKNARDAVPALDKIQHFLEESGKNQTSVGIEARISYGDGNPASWEGLIRDWQEVGATHISINTMSLGFQSPDQHMQALRGFAATIGIGDQED